MWDFLHRPPPTPLRPIEKKLLPPLQSEPFTCWGDENEVLKGANAKLHAYATRIQRYFRRFCRYRLVKRRVTRVHGLSFLQNYVSTRKKNALATWHQQTAKWTLSLVLLVRAHEKRMLQRLMLAKVAIWKVMTARRNSLRKLCSEKQGLITENLATKNSVSRGKKAYTSRRADFFALPRSWCWEKV